MCILEAVGDSFAACLALNFVTGIIGKLTTFHFRLFNNHILLHWLCGDFRVFLPKKRDFPQTGVYFPTQCAFPKMWNNNTGTTLFEKPTRLKILSFPLPMDAERCKVDFDFFKFDFSVLFACFSGWAVAGFVFRVRLWLRLALAPCFSSAHKDSVYRNLNFDENRF